MQIYSAWTDRTKTAISVLVTQATQDRCADRLPTRACSGENAPTECLPFSLSSSERAFKIVVESYMYKEAEKTVVLLTPLKKQQNIKGLKELRRLNTR